MEGFVHYNNYYDLIRLSSYLAEPCGPCDLLTTRNAGSGECRLPLEGSHTGMPLDRCDKLIISVCGTDWVEEENTVYTMLLGKIS